MPPTLPAAIDQTLASHGGPLTSPTLQMAALLAALGLTMLAFRRRVRPGLQALARRLGLPSSRRLADAAVALWYLNAVLMLVFGTAAIALELVIASGAMDPEIQAVGDAP